MSAADALVERRKVWIAMSDLWLDNELQPFEIKHIAEVLRAAGITEEEADRIFVLELAPFLGWNHLSVAGVWDGFDPDWVCREAERRMTRPSLVTALVAKTGITTYAARASWTQVKRTAYPAGGSPPSP